MIIQLFLSIIAVYFTASVYQSPEKLIKYTALIGGLGWLCYLFFAKDYNLMVAIYLSSFLIATLSNITAIFFKVPVTVFFIPSFIPLVPGATMYRSIYSYIMGNHSAGTAYLLETFFIAIMIALAILTSDSLFKTFFLIRSKLQIKNIP